MLNERYEHSGFLCDFQLVYALRIICTKQQRLSFVKLIGEIYGNKQSEKEEKEKNKMGA